MCGLDRAFDIPEEVEYVWVSLHDKSAVHRAVGKVRWYRDHGEDYPEIHLTEFGKFSIITEKALDKLLEPLVGKTVYIQCEYMG